MLHLSGIIAAAESEPEELGWQTKMTFLNILMTL